jgi:hypothetical protein
MKRFFFVPFLFFGLLVPLFSQSNELLDLVLSETELSASSAAYLLASAAGGDTAPDSREAAFSSMEEHFAGMGSSISAGEYALLLQQQFDLPRGLVSRIAPSPRYALRDLKFLNMIQGRAHTDTPISGERALRILGRVLTELEVRS